MYQLAISSDELLQGHDFHIVILKQPKTEKAVQFAFAQDYSTLYEVVHHKPELSCWFIDSEVCSNGSLTYLTKCDPLFLALDYLYKQYKTNPERYSPLEQILDDEDYPHTRKLCRCKELSNLHLYSDFKGADDFKAYKYSEEKVLRWLEKKVEKLACFLQTSKTYVSAGAQSSNFVRSNNSEFQTVDYKLYAFGIISDYLNPELSSLLRQHLKLPEKVKPAAEEPAPKKGKTGSIHCEPIEDNSKGVLAEKQPQLNKKLSTTQKKLAKIDKTGMKSLTSFFSVKPKSN